MDTFQKDDENRSFKKSFVVFLPSSACVNVRKWWLSRKKTDFKCEDGIFVTDTKFDIVFVTVGAKNEQKSIIFDEQNMDTHLQLMISYD